MPYVTIHTAKTTLSKLIARVVAGEEIVIARGAMPVAKLVPLDYAPTNRKFGALRGKVAVTAAFFEPLPPEELAAWDELP